MELWHWSKGASYRKYNVILMLLNQYDRAVTQAYGRWREQLLNGLGTSVQMEITKRLSLEMTARQEMLNGKLQPFVFKGMLVEKLRKNMSSYLYAIGGRNYNYPSLNDLYWVPGGNPGLERETAWQLEAGAVHEMKQGRNFMARIKSTAFYNNIYNYIQWQPANASYWEAQNLGRVISRGVEAGVQAEYRPSGSLRIGWNNQYTYTRSTDMNAANAERQLIYVPVHQGLSALRLYVKKIYFTAEYQYTGSRNTIDDALPAFGLLNGIIGYNFKGKKAGGHIQLRLNNILDTQYQVIAWRAMPGRNFMLDLKLNILKK